MCMVHNYKKWLPTECKTLFNNSHVVASTIEAATLSVTKFEHCRSRPQKILFQFVTKRSTYFGRLYLERHIDIYFRINCNQHVPSRTFNCYNYCGINKEID